MNIKYEESPITCCTAVPQKDHNIVLGTAHGRVTMFDLRREKIKCRAPVVFKQIDGAIKDVACAENDSSTVYSVGLDRYFRVHDLNTKETIVKVSIIKILFNCFNLLYIQLIIFISVSALHEITADQSTGLNKSIKFIYSLSLNAPQIIKMTDI